MPKKKKDRHLRIMPEFIVDTPTFDPDPEKIAEQWHQRIGWRVTDVKFVSRTPVIIKCGKDETPTNYHGRMNQYLDIIKNDFTVKVYSFTGRYAGVDWDKWYGSGGLGEIYNPYIGGLNYYSGYHHAFQREMKEKKEWFHYHRSIGIRKIIKEFQSGMHILQELFAYYL